MFGIQTQQKKRNCLKFQRTTTEHLTAYVDYCFAINCFFPSAHCDRWVMRGTCLLKLNFANKNDKMSARRNRQTLRRRWRNKFAFDAHCARSNFQWCWHNHSRVKKCPNGPTCSVFFAIVYYFTEITAKTSPARAWHRTIVGLVFLYHSYNMSVAGACVFLSFFHRLCGDWHYWIQVTKPSVERLCWTIVSIYGCIISDDRRTQAHTGRVNRVHLAQTSSNPHNQCATTHRWRANWNCVHRRFCHQCPTTTIREFKQNIKNKKMKKEIKK